MPTFKAQVHEEIEQKDTPAKSKSKNKNKQLTKVQKKATHKSKLK